MTTDAYKLHRDRAASSRLNFQHMLWVDTFGHILHPEIEAASQRSSEFELIDVGTGTGVVPLQLSKHLARQPKSLVGLDISSQQFPLSQWLPKNVQLVVGDVFDVNQPAPELRNRFDAVHVRYLLSLIDDDANKFIDFVLKLLKPGGYFQWGEPLPQSLRVESDGKPAVGMESLTSYFRSNLPTSWLDNLPETLRERGFEIVESGLVELEPWQRGWWVDNLVGVALEFPSPLPISVAEQVDQEMKEGSFVDIRFISVVARLPKV